jgi:hypothetical protein
MLRIPAKTCRKSPYTLVAPSKCSTRDSASPGPTEMSPGSFQGMVIPIALEDLQNLPSVLEAAGAESRQGVIIISLPEAHSHSRLDMDITHPTMVQSLALHEEVITLEYEKIEKQTAITIPAAGPRMDINPAGLEELVLSFEDHVQKGAVAQVDYVADILVTSLERRKQLRLPSSKITNPAGNALLYTSSKFDGIHTPMAYLSGGYGMEFAFPLAFANTLKVLAFQRTSRTMVCVL